MLNRSTASIAAKSRSHKKKSQIFKMPFESRNSQPATHNPQPATHNPQPATRNPQPATRNPNFVTPSIWA